jgi:hypothetical protein
VHARDIENRFTFHPATTPDRRAAHETVRHDCRVLAEHLDDILFEGREKELAIQKLEEVMFWANASLARQEEE